MEMSKREAKIKLIIIAIKVALPTEAQCTNCSMSSGGCLPD
jgi:hypothetical protein